MRGHLIASRRGGPASSTATLIPAHRITPMLLLLLMPALLSVIDQESEHTITAPS